MSVDLLTIFIPVIISLVGLIPAILSYINSKPTRETKRKQEADAELVEAEEEKVHIASMERIMEATNKLLVEPLKERVSELEKDKKLLKEELENNQKLFSARIKQDEADMVVLLERISKLEEENVYMSSEFAKTHGDLCAALEALSACKADLEHRMTLLEGCNVTEPKHSGDVTQE